MPGPSGYTSALIAVELEGKVVGLAQSADGGGAVGQVAGNDQGTPPVRRKDISGVIFEPIVIEVGSGMEPELYDWINETLQNDLPRRDGRILFLNYQQNVRRALAWTDGLLTEIRFPELDSGAKETSKIRLTVGAESVSRTAGGGSVNVASGSRLAKQWSTFSLSISNMTTAPRYAALIGPITVRQPYVSPPGPGGTGASTATTGLDVSDVSVSVAEAQATELYDWHDRFVIQGYNAAGDERTARIEYLGSTQQSLLTLDLTGVGIRRIQSESEPAGRVSVVARARADLYIEEVALTVPQPAATTGSGTGTGTTAGTSTGGTGPVADPMVRDELVRVLRDALVGDGGVLASLPTHDSSAVAERLIRSTDGGAEPAAAADRSAEGRILGTDWARNRASLEELEELAGVAEGDWSALTLAEGHSLVPELRKRGAVAAEQVGDVVLERDPFLEGVVEGAADVFAEVRPVLRERGIRR